MDISTQKSRFRDIWPLLPAAIYLVGFLVMVLFYLIGLSLSDTNGTSFPTFATWARVVSDEACHRAFVNTLVFTIIGTPLELFAGILLALLLYKKCALRGTMRSFFMIPLAVPALVTAILLYILFDFPGGHVNHLLQGKYLLFPGIIQEPLNWRGSALFSLGVSLCGKVWRDMPISMLIILAGLTTIDVQLFDAARTMGAGWRAQLRHIVLPLILPSMSAVVLLRSIEMWKEFIFPFVLAGKHNLLGTLIESYYNDWGSPHEAAVVAVLLVACIAVTTVGLLFLTELARRSMVRR